jgi:hypothetical protein
MLTAPGVRLAPPRPPEVGRCPREVTAAVDFLDYLGRNADRMLELGI